MKEILIISAIWIIAIWATLLNINNNNNNNNIVWKTTVWTVTDSAPMEDWKFAYVLEYNIETNKNLKNIDGKLIKGPIKQNIFWLDKLVKNWQQIELKYDYNEPTHYKIIWKLQYEEENLNDIKQANNSLEKTNSWEVNNIYFDEKEKVWKDNYWICHTCTPENGFMPDWTQQ
jgi:hypothetical protein